jgi:hypothetical protein
MHEEVLDVLFLAISRQFSLEELPAVLYCCAVLERQMSKLCDCSGLALIEMVLKVLVLLYKLESVV